MQIQWVAFLLPSTSHLTAKSRTWYWYAYHEIFISNLTLSTILKIPNKFRASRWWGLPGPELSTTIKSKQPPIAIAISYCLVLNRKRLFWKKKCSTGTILLEALLSACSTYFFLFKYQSCLIFVKPSEKLLLTRPTYLSQLLRHLRVAFKKFKKKLQKFWL